MKKLDTSKPAISGKYGTSAVYLGELEGYSIPRFVYKFKVDEKREVMDIVNEFGVSEYSSTTFQAIQNVPETITFWVPVWWNKINSEYEVGAIMVSKEKPTDEDSVTHHEFVRWDGPFTIKND